MGKINIQIPLTAAQDAAANAGIDAVKTNIVNPVNLSKAERQSTPTIAGERAGMIDDGLHVSASNPELVSTFAGTTAQYNDAVTYFRQLEVLKVKHASMLEVIEDTQQLAGNFIFNFNREVYASAIRGADAGLPGADAIVELYAKYFTQSPAPAPEPTP